MIRFGYYTPSVVLSSDLQDVNIFTDHSFVDFRLSCGPSTVVESRYYAYNGTIIISDICSLIEDYLAGQTENTLSEFTISATAGDESAELSFTVLYCDRTLGLFAPEDWLRQNFLTLSQSRRIAPDDFIQLSWYTTEREGISFRVYATFINDKGVRDTYYYAHSGNGLIAHFNGIMTECVWLRQVREKIKTALKLESLTLLSVSIRCGDRSASFYIDHALAGVVPFYYLNCFGVPEHISLPRTTTEKIKTDRSIATVGKSSQFYDITTSKEYEVVTGALSSDECLQVEQMLTSPSVGVPFGPDEVMYETDFDALHIILISDFTSEISDGNDKLNSVKFTWRFADNKPKVAARNSPGIFNDKFNPVFS